MGGGRRHWVWVMEAFGAAATLLAPVAAWAAGGEKAAPLIAVADTRHAAGRTKWIGDLYNGDLWVFAAAVVGLMALQGLVLGLGFDKLIGLLGLDLSKLDHHE